MSKFTGFILCVVSASLISNYVTLARKHKKCYCFKSVLEKCMQKYNLTGDDIEMAARTGNTTTIPPCFSACVIRQSGFETKTVSSTLRDYLRPVLEECMKEFNVTDEDINTAAETGNPNIIPPCFNGCVFTKSGFLNAQGEYDLEGGMAYLRPLIKDDEEYNLYNRVATNCTSENVSVTEGKGDCERGGRLSTCFLTNKDLVPL